MQEAHQIILQKQVEFLIKNGVDPRIKVFSLFVAFNNNNSLLYILLIQIDGLHDRQP